MEPMIKIEHLDKTFKGKTQTVYALKDINLDIQKGDIFGIIGQSGAGKSTLLRCFNGLENFQKGEVIVDGQAISSLNKKQMSDIQKEMGMIFQNFNLLNRLNVYDNIAFAMRAVGRNRKSIKKRVSSVLEIVGLSQKARSLPTQLSGGEQQRVAIARAIVNSPKMIIADEPTGNIDPKMSLEVMEMLDIINKSGITVLVVTH